MKHIFIINPVAGQGNTQEGLCKSIIEISDRLGISYEVYFTKAVGDATKFVSSYCKCDDDVRFYACGGDGTLNEVVNGAIKFTNAQVGMIPIGTGNDFPRSFTNSDFFSDVMRQIDGAPRKVDLIRCHDKSTNSITYAVNMMNIGFDCDVVAQTAKLKHYPLLEGSFAYYAGIAVTLFKRLGKKMKIVFDDMQELDGEFLLTSIANGRTYGGGFKAAPKASISDGMLDIGVVKRVGRIRFLSLIGKYKEGTHLESEATKDIVIYKRCKSLVIAPGCSLNICIDGEIFNMGEIEFSVVPQGLNFSFPNGVCELENEPIFTEFGEKYYTAMQS